MAIVQRNRTEQESGDTIEHQHESNDFEFSAAANQHAANLAVAANLTEAANFDANTNNSHDRDSDDVIEVR